MIQMNLESLLDDDEPWRPGDFFVLRVTNNIGGTSIFHVLILNDDMRWASGEWSSGFKLSNVNKLDYLTPAGYATDITTQKSYQKSEFLAFIRPSEGELTS
jgi:hypothetical protein